MTIEQHTNQPTIYEQFLSVLVRPRTYVNMAYLLLSFPLGLIYFIILVLGFSLGISLLIIWVGLPILVVMILLSYAITTIERQMAIAMLGVKINVPLTENPPTSLWERFKGMLRNPITWKGILFQFIKFPMGVVSFVILFALTTIPLTLMAAPFVYNLPGVSILRTDSFNLVMDLNQALFAAFIGLVLLVSSMHAFNGLAWAHAQLAKALLGSGE